MLFSEDFESEKFPLATVRGSVFLWVPKDLDISLCGPEMIECSWRLRIARTLIASSRPGLVYGPYVHRNCNSFYRLPNTIVSLFVFPRTQNERKKMCPHHVIYYSVSLFQAAFTALIDGAEICVFVVVRRSSSSSRKTNRQKCRSSQHEKSESQGEK